MAEAPTIIETPLFLEEHLLLNFTLKYNKKDYIIDFFDINNDMIKIKARENSNEINDNYIKMYQSEIIINELKSKHKYFKMFDNNEECKINIIDLCKNEQIKISNIDEKELILIINLGILKDNLIYIPLQRVEMSDKDKLLYLQKDLNDKNKKIEELNIEIKQIKENLKLKDDKIIELEKAINSIINRLDNLEKIKNLINVEKSEEIISVSSKKILDSSNIIKNIKELKFLYDAISINKNVSFELLYNSESDGENIQKLKSVYIGVEDIIILIKTKKNHRFGGYAHESFLDKEFEKKDLKAFLFNLDKLSIYKSKGTEHTIWKSNLDSIDFGWGTDLRLFYKFSSKQNYTNQGEDFEYKEEKFALNGEKYFEVLYFELYKVNIK